MKQNQILKLTYENNSVKKMFYCKKYYLIIFKSHNKIKQFG